MYTYRSFHTPPPALLTEKVGPLAFTVVQREEGPNRFFNLGWTAWTFLSIYSYDLYDLYDLDFFSNVFSLTSAML